MLVRSWLICVAATVIAAAIPPALVGQWLGYPTAGVPRTPDGKPNLTAPAPRTADGKPDLSGMWGWKTIEHRPAGRVAPTCKSVGSF